jgi:hypothetical protein
MWRRWSGSTTNVPELSGAQPPALRHDSSTNALIRRYRSLKR